MAYIARMRFEAPSKILRINDDLTAFAFDAAVTLTAAELDNRRDHDRLTALIRSLYALVVSAFGGDPKEVLSDTSSDRPMHNDDDDDNIL